MTGCGGVAAYISRRRSKARRKRSETPSQTSARILANVRRRIAGENERRRKWTAKNDALEAAGKKRRFPDLSALPDLSAADRHKLRVRVETALAADPRGPKFNAICPYCFLRLTAKTIAPDHAAPFKRGGSSKLKNVVLICRRCNALKGRLFPWEYKELRRALDYIPEEARRDIERRLLRGAMVYAPKAKR